MKPNVDRPSSWVKYKKGLCENCSAGCCTMPVEVEVSDLVHLDLVSEDEAQDSHKKLAKRLMKEKIIKSYRHGTGFFMLEQRPNGDCIFLGSEDRRCTVYEKRPKVCRRFPEIGPRPGHCPTSRQKRGAQK